MKEVVDFLKKYHDHILMLNIIFYFTVILISYHLKQSYYLVEKIKMEKNNI